MIQCDFCDREATIFDAPNPANAELNCGDPYCDCEYCMEDAANWCELCHNHAWQDV